MAKYWASCSPGLEFALVAELKKFKNIQILQDASIFGGVVFSTVSAVTEILNLRAADNVYAFVGKFQGVPFDKDAAMLYFKDLAELADWDSSLDLFQRWKACEVANSNVQGTTLSFRVSCDRACVMKRKHSFTSMEAAAAVGEGVHKRFGWSADMCFYDLEVLAWIRDDEILIALALLERVMSKTLELAAEELPSCSQEVIKKSELKHNSVERSSRAKRAECQLHARRAYRKALVSTSLKPSVAYALLQLGAIVPGDIILDPMCGCATIPLEGAESFRSQVHCMGGDISSRAVNTAFENVNGATLDCDLLQWNASNLPVRSGVVDRIICDMPFGNRCGTSRTRDFICPKVLREIVRILRVRTGVAVLLGQSKAVKLEVGTSLKPFIRPLQTLSVQMEGLRVEVLVLQRTEEPYQGKQSTCKGKGPKQ